MSAQDKLVQALIDAIVDEANGYREVVKETRKKNNDLHHRKVKSAWIGQVPSGFLSWLVHEELPIGATLFAGALGVIPIPRSVSFDM